MITTRYTAKSLKIAVVAGVVALVKEPWIVVLVRAPLTRQPRLEVAAKQAGSQRSTKGNWAGEPAPLPNSLLNHSRAPCGSTWIPCLYMYMDDNPQVPKNSLKYYIVKLMSLPQTFGVKINNLWNHHPVFPWDSPLTFNSPLLVGGKFSHLNP